MNNNFVNLISYGAVLLHIFYIASIFVSIIIQYLYIFHPDDLNNLQVSTLRWKTNVLKIFLAIAILLINQVFPLKLPPLFQMWAKGKDYDG